MSTTSVTITQTARTTATVSKFDEQQDDKTRMTVIPGQNDFFRVNDDEPHCLRRRVILAKYPQIKQLFGHDPHLPVQVGAIVVLQIVISITLVLYPPPIWLFVAIAYVVGGTCNHALMVAMHEFSHNLGFKYQPYNFYFATFVVNAPLSVPYYVRFKRYHMDHHRYQGVEKYDVVLPTTFEGNLFNNTLMKLLYVIFHIFIYAVRPLFINPKPIGQDEIMNGAAVFLFDTLLTVGTGSYMPVLYLFLSTFFGGGLHPCAGNFIAEHYIFHTEKDGDDSKVPHHVTETYSYYGPLNAFNFNVGYHNEHHDFPFVPGSRLPQVRAIAPEFYDTLPHHTSYIKVIWDYITDPSITAFRRVKRPTTSALAAEEDPYGVPFDVVATKNKNIKNGTNDSIKTNQR